MEHKFAIHKKDARIVPMQIVGDANEVLSHMCSTSKSLVGSCVEDFDLQNLKHGVGLDPGGMLHTKTPVIDIEIDGAKFWTYASKISGVLQCTQHASERIPGYMRMPNRWWHSIIPVGIFNELILKLRKLEMSDNVLNSNLELEQFRQKAEEDGIIYRMDVPRK